MNPKTGYSIYHSERLSDSVRRAIAEEIATAATHLRDLDQDPEKNCHEARRHLKKARALLMLVRASIENAPFHEVNRRCREAGASFTRLRDLHVSRSTLQHLVAGDPVLQPDAFAPLTSAMSNLDAELTVQVRDSNLGQACSDSLGLAKTAVERLTIPSHGWNCIKRGLRESVRNGQVALKAALKSPVDELLHALRKQAKTMRYQFEFLEKVWPEIMHALVDEIHVLSDRLGEYHDITVMRTLVNGFQTLNDHVELQSTLWKLVEDRQTALIAEALPLARRIYAERPDELTKRMKTYLRVWRTERK